MKKPNVLQVDIHHPERDLSYVDPDSKIVLISSGISFLIVIAVFYKIVRYRGVEEDGKKGESAEKTTEKVLSPLTDDDKREIIFNEMVKTLLLRNY